jgi:23S rRNA pseudouridine1911/1915/1917 synthase
MVASKDDTTHNALAALFKSRTLTREYIAIVAPRPPQVTGTFDTMYGRHPVHRKKFSSKVPKGKQAVTRYEVAERFGELAAIVRVRLSTGRTHQIRVHFADAGSPVLGDTLYSRRPRKEPLGQLYDDLGRQALHAHRLEFVHPITREELAFTTEPREDMQRAITALRGLMVEPGR